MEIGTQILIHQNGDLYFLPFAASLLHLNKAVGCFTPCFQDYTAFPHLSYRTADQV